MQGLQETEVAQQVMWKLGYSNAEQTARSTHDGPALALDLEEAMMSVRDVEAYFVQLFMVASAHLLHEALRISTPVVRTSGFRLLVERRRVLI